jgi:RNA polymerase sigma-B factor
MSWLSPEDTFVMIEEAQAGDREAEEALIVAYAPLVKSVIHRFYRGPESREDLFQLGCIGLLHAVRKFDTGRGTNFATLALPEIHGSILNFLRDHGSPIKLPRHLRASMLRLARLEGDLAVRLGRTPSDQDMADAVGESLAYVRNAKVMDYVSNISSIDQTGGCWAELGNDPGDFALADILSDPNDTSFEEIENAMDAETLMSCLGPREREIVRQHFFEERSQREIAEEVDVSQMHVSRLLRRAIFQMRQAAQGLPQPEGSWRKYASGQKPLSRTG